MPKLTKKFKIENYDTLQRERDALAEYAWHTVNRVECDVSETIDGDPAEHEVTRFDVYGLQRACGGVIVTLHFHDGQSTGFNVDYFDSWLEKIRSIGYVTEHTSTLQHTRLALLRKALSKPAAHPSRRERIADKGSRVELHPGCDLWMRGAKYGTVVRIEGDILIVRMDHKSVKKLQRVPRDRVTPTKF